jgi:hypothetical protein
MKKLLNIVVLIAAMNFVAVAGAVGYLLASGRLSSENTGKISEILFPPPTSQPSTRPATQPVAEPRPLMRLEELLAKKAGRPATEQVEFIRNAFDERMAQLDRRHREVEDLQRTVEAAREQLAIDRAALDIRQKSLDAKQAEAIRQEQDAGFQAELKLYASMPAAQVKSVMMGLDESLAAKYLQAMSPRTAAKILREFKTPDERSRRDMILERIRTAGGEVPAEGAGGGGGGRGTPVAPSALGN